MKFVFLVISVFFLVACTPRSSPQSFFQLTPVYLQHKALQTRRVETPEKNELFSASATVLQDLGFQLEESDLETGMLRAVKERSAREYGQEIGRFFLFLIGLFGQTTLIIPVDLHQQIAATLVMFPVNHEKTSFNVRIVFHRTLWKSDGNVGRQSIQPGGQTMEMINDPLIYQQFFSKLSKSVFLQIHEI